MDWSWQILWRSVAPAMLEVWLALRLWFSYDYIFHSHFFEIMKELMDYGLWFAGFGFTMLVLASFWIPGILGWKEKLAGLTPLMRELFWTYAGYVFGSHVLFTVLSLGYHDWLLSGTPAAGVISAFICLWWTVRVYLQFFGFDLAEVEDSWFNRLAKHLLTLLFIYLMVFFGILTWWNFGGAG